MDTGIPLSVGRRLRSAGGRRKVARLGSLRAVCRIFRDRIDAAARNLLEGDRSGSEEGLSLGRRAGLCKLGIRHVCRLKRLRWASFVCLAEHRCALCGKGFSGCISPIGILAHGDCLFRASISTIYFRRPLTRQAQLRIVQVSADSLVQVSRHQWLTEAEAESRLSLQQCEGYSGGTHGLGKYTYKQALWPACPMLPALQTV
jgi:hypothetical protein